jgi:hypothetical protein
MAQSSGLVDRVYALEAGIPAETAAMDPKSEVAAFARERAREGTRFTAALFLTAWRLSEQIELPDWAKGPAGPNAAPPG